MALPFPPFPPPFPPPFSPSFPLKMPPLFSISLQFSFLCSFCLACSPTWPQSPPILIQIPSTPAPSPPSSPCCSPLVHSGPKSKFHSGHLHFEFHPPKGSKCLSNVSIHCSPKTFSSSQKIEVAIFDGFGHFLAYGEGKVHLKGKCEKNEGKWKWKFGEEWANEKIECIWRKEKEWKSEEEEEGGRTQKIAIFLLKDKL